MQQGITPNTKLSRTAATNITLGTIRIRSIQKQVLPADKGIGGRWAETGVETGISRQKSSRKPGTGTRWNWDRGKQRATEDTMFVRRGAPVAAPAVGAVQRQIRLRGGCVARSGTGHDACGS